jgi:hypothetical protein
MAPLSAANDRELKFGPVAVEKKPAVARQNFVVLGDFDVAHIRRADLGERFLQVSKNSWRLSKIMPCRACSIASSVVGIFKDMAAGLLWLENGA